jgi:dienelactone hydrolase
MFASILAAAMMMAATPACAPASGFTGTICAPAATGKHPAILLLGGSEGGDQMKYAAPRFAQHGFVAASVAYFGMTGLPKELVDIPVETVGKALDAIAKRPDVDPNRIAIMGLSKGGEFALLAASTYPQIRAVVADVPSPFAWQGISASGGDPQSSWTLGGKPLPFVAYAPAMGQLFASAYMEHKPLDLRTGYEASMRENAAQIPAAMFHLENIHGPVMLIAAGDDRIWDSVAQCETAVAYLHAHHHPYADTFLQYPDAGHIFLFATPQRAMTQAPMGPFTLMLGGTAQTNVAAAQEAWPKISTFLTAALK